jgi:cytoskeletal protein RodZ
MSDPWMKLKAARLASQWRIEEVAAVLEVPASYLQALENGTFSALPDSVDTRHLLRTYARFLQIDPRPLLHAQPELDHKIAAPALSRSHRKRCQRKKWALWGSVAGVVFVAGVSLIWFFLLEDEASLAESVKQPKTTITEAPKAVQKQMKPEVHLLKSSATYPYGDLFTVSHVDRIELKLTARQPTAICVRAGGPTGAVLAEKKLLPQQTETFTHERWLSLQILQPQVVTISVNGVIIDSTSTKKAQLYQFRMEAE